MLLPAASPLLLDLGCFLTLLLIGDAVAAGEPAAFKLAVAVHMWLRIYDGRFSGWRKATWLGLVAFALLLVAGGFLAYALPWGQMSFWLAAKLGDVGWRIAAWLGTPGGIFWGIVGFVSWAVLMADMLALHVGRQHSRRLWIGAALLLVVLVIVAIGHDILRFMTPLVPSTGGLPTPTHLLPDAGSLAAFAVLRSMPTKPLGVALLALVLLLPIVTVWTQGSRFHAPETRLAWLGFNAGLGLDWVALAGLGASPPSDACGWGALALVAYQIAFFLVVPIMLARFLRPQTSAVRVFE